MEHVKDENNIGMFSFGYSSTNVVVKEEDFIYPFQSYLAEVGGALGLFLGFSFVGLLDPSIETLKYLSSCLIRQKKQ